MTTLQNAAAKGQVPVAYPSFAGQVVAQRFTYTVPAAVVEGSIIEMACIPPGCRVVDMILDSDDLDTGTPAIALDVGVMSGDWGDPGNSRTCGAEFFSGATVAQGGGVVRPTAKTAFRVAASATARSIGVKIATDAATAAEGEIGLTVMLATA